MSEQIDNRNYNELCKALDLAQHTVYKRYLEELEQYWLIAPTEALKDETADNCLRFLQLKQFVCKKGEDIFQKLSTVYHASMSLGCNLIVMIDVKSVGAEADIYLGVRNSYITEQSGKDLGTSFETLKSGLDSNFPGTEYEVQRGMDELIKDIFGNHAKYISAVSCVASARDKSKTQDKNFIQGMEKFIDAMRGHAYTAIFIAEPIEEDEQVMIRNGYESLYSTLSSFNKSSWSYNENESTSIMENLSEGISEAITEGTSRTQAHAFNNSVNIGVNSSESRSQTNSSTESNSYTKPTKGAMAAKVASPVLGVVGGIVGGVISVNNPLVGAGVGMAVGGAAGNVIRDLFGNNTHTHSTTETVANTVGKTLGMSTGINVGHSDTKSNTTSHNETSTKSETKTTGTTDSKGTGCTLQIENVNKSIEEMLKRIDEQLKRVKEGEDYGSYSCGAYFLSGKQGSSLLAANTYRALMIGEGSSVESSAVNFWNGNKEEQKEKVIQMKEYLSRFAHPVFAMPLSETIESTSDFITYTAGTVVSGLELPMHLGLPTKSVYGLPVLEHAEFGRNIVHKDKLGNEEEAEERIKLGNIYHMGQMEKKSVVDLDIQNLASHTFITGSTGSGKSNTVYQLLRELNKQKVNFLVVEPAKGEYKHIFGNTEAKVYGSNPYLTALLKINPFRFPKGIHVLEHIDRLIEIFNVCWPMYAAMPAVLKDSVERAYVNAGWNLSTSQNKYSDELYPTFVDILNELNCVVTESAFSQEVKDNYIGSLATRIKSLTNGIYGCIFDNDELGDEKLFDENVIVDLSRVGSVETKSMIMGILVMRLQEYRMVSGKMNADLNHVTVLEEAHNLLKKTSTEQSSESSNLLGKSVEMLSNAIAEVRTYGEGFIIADQAPGLLDMSVIRNTNTKIIMRLPDAEDRNLVGKSANLSEDQIKELAKIPTGVAAVYQNNWLEPVLCQVHYEKTEGVYDNKEEMSLINENLKRKLIERLLNKVAGERLDISMNQLIENIIKSPLATRIKTKSIELFRRNGAISLNDISSVVYDIVSSPEIEKEAEETESIEDWKNVFLYSENSVVSDFSEEKQNEIVECILKEQIARYDKPDEYLETWYKYIRGEVL